MEWKAGRDNPRSISLVVRNENWLGPHSTIATSKAVSDIRIGHLLSVDFQVAGVIIDKNPNLSDPELVALFDPGNLPIVIHRFHAVT